MMLALLTVLAAVEFNRDVRPILSDRCFACHGPDNANRKTKMRLDTAEGARGFVLPGQPDDSPVMKRILSTNRTLRMPPAYAGHDALKEREVAVLREWIAAGAKYEGHWSFVPPKKSAAKSLDEIVRARLAREGLQPSPRAPQHTLIRRVTFDLTGLPPAPADLDEDYARAVDRLLASPRFGERFAMRWLDVARYSDTNGYQSDGVRDMWRWRDWVIQAFNQNKPFDQFTIEQIAGDLLPNATLDQKIATGFHRNHRTTAEGGIVDEEFRVEYLSDRAETTSAVWLGLTMGCSRCHDHKYDPITQRDYYSLWAFFNNTPERGFVYNFGNEEPFIKAPTPPQQARLAELQAQVDTAEKAWNGAQSRLAREQATWEKTLRRSKSATAWVDPRDLRVNEPAAQSFDGKREIKLESAKAAFNHREPWTLSARINPANLTEKLCVLSRHEDYYEGQGYAVYVMDGRVQVHYVFRWTDLGMRFQTKAKLAPGWHHIAVTYDGSMKVRDGHARIFVDGVDQELDILFDQNLWPLEHKATFRIGAGGGAPESNFKGDIEDVRVYARALTPAQVAVLANRDALEAIAAKPIKKRTVVEANKLHDAFLDHAKPAELAALNAARAEYDKYLATVPTVMSMVENGPMPTRDAFILKRGAYDAHGDKVTPAVPHFLPALPAGAPANRLGLARWLVSRDNPLTARVTVNRIWQMLFGIGLVKTTEDFGSQGEWPLQPELLDWLAVDFMESGWDVKRLIRTIVLSDTYQQSSRVTPELLARDPENRLLARGPRYRLPAEMIRDQALAVSGLLVPTVGGPPVKPYQPPGLWKELFGGTDYKEDTGEGLYRRSLYTYWKRTVPPPFMINFDAPMRETCVVRENRTNTPLQALNLMNDVQFVEAARVLAQRMLREGGTAPKARLTFAYRLTLARDPQPRELDALLKLLDRYQGDFARDAAAAAKFVAHGQAPRDTSLDAKEHAAYAALASLILNLDEAVTKE